MSPMLDAPKRPKSKETAAERRAGVLRSARAFQWAGYTYVLSRIVDDLTEAVSTRETVKVLQEAIAAGQYTLSSGDTLVVPTPPKLKAGERLDDPTVLRRVTPSHAWVAQRRQVLRDGVLTVNACLPKARPGRPKSEVDPQLRDWLMKRYLGSPTLSVRALMQLAKDQAKKEGWVCPKRDRLRAEVEDLPALTAAVRRSGKRGGLADAGTKGALPYERPFQLWVFDEGTLPVYIRVRDPVKRCYVPIRPTICVVVDVASQLVMGYWIGNPLARGAQAHMDSLEMTEALLSAIIPTLASPECREYVGFLPERVGCDNIATHNPVMTALERVGIVTTKHGPYAPWSHGPRETVVGILKAMCEPLLGFDGRFVVADTLTEDPIKTRKALSGTQYRDTPRANITTEQLLDIMAFRKAFQDVVQRYNRELEHSRWKETRESRYYEYRRTEALRPWTDAMGMLETTRVTVREHIAVRQVDFATQSTAGHRFAFGDSVTLRVDPMLRACFVPGATPEEWGALLPAKEFAKHVVPGEVVREQHHAAQAASDAARAARDALQLEALGSETEVAIANAAAALAAKTKRKTAKPRSSDPAASKRASKHRTESDPLRAPLPPVDAPPLLFPEEILDPRATAPASPVVPPPVAPPVTLPRMSVITGNPDAPVAPRAAPTGSPSRGLPMRGLPRAGSTVALLTRRPSPPLSTESQETSA